MTDHPQNQDSRREVRRQFTELARKHAHYGHGGPNDVCTSFDAQELDMFFKDVQAIIDTAVANELKELIKRHSEQHETKQAVIAVHDNIPAGSTLGMVPVVHINDRLAELSAQTESPKPTVDKKGE